MKHDLYFLLVENIFNSLYDKYIVSVLRLTRENRLLVVQIYFEIFGGGARSKVEFC